MAPASVATQELLAQADTSVSVQMTIVTKEPGPKVGAKVSPAAVGGRDGAVAATGLAVGAKVSPAAVGRRVDGGSDGAVAAAGLAVGAKVAAGPAVDGLPVDGTGAVGLHVRRRQM